MRSSLALYFHWPFCQVKCPYCDFNSHVRNHVNEAEWEAAYITQINHYLRFIQTRKVVSVFFGGGTPSLASPRLIGNILASLKEQNIIDESVEVTLEANPTSLESAKVPLLRAAGINRLSLGIQSLRDDSLKFLGRKHTSKEAVQAIETTSKYFDNFSFDLIYALPDQDITSWQQELRESLTIAGPHISLYQLTIEPGTPFARQAALGQLEVPDPDTAADFYQATEEIIAEHSMSSYEISNYCRAPIHQCQHNLQYWRYGDFLGIGPGAHSRVTWNGENDCLPFSLLDSNNLAPLVIDNLRHSHATDPLPRLATMDHKMPEKWLAAVHQREIIFSEMELLDPAKVYQEKLLMGLRLKEGIEVQAMKEAKLEELISLGLLRKIDNKIAATERGFLLLDSIVAELLL